MFDFRWLSNEMRSKLKATFAKIQRWITDLEGQYDPQLIFLLSQVILYCPDSLSLRNSFQVDALQTKYAHLLLMYIDFRYGNVKGTRTRFAECLKVVSYTRDIIVAMEELYQNPELKFVFTNEFSMEQYHEM